MDQELVRENKIIRDNISYIEDILECIDKINIYVKGLSKGQFSEDWKTIDAVVRNFEIIGEASRQLPVEHKEKYPEIDWRAMIDFRNAIIHEYFRINISIVWDIILNELPSLYEKLKQIK